MEIFCNTTKPVLSFCAERIESMGKHKYVLLIYMIVMAGFLVSCKTVIFDGKDKPLPTTPASKLPAVSDNKKEEAEKQPEKPVQESETGKQQETVTNAVEPSPTPVMVISDSDTVFASSRTCATCP